MTGTSTQARCACGSPVTRVMLDGAHPFAQLSASLPAVCDECVARAEQQDAERSERETAERRAAEIAERVRRSGLPAKHHLTVDALDHPALVVGAARRWAQHGGGLLLTGRFGRGKTFVAGAAAFTRLQSRPVVWTSAPLLFARLGTGLGTEQRDWALQTLSGREALVLDDVDKARPTEYGAEQVFLAIDQRCEHETPLLVTTNLSVSGLADRWPEPYGEAIASRLAGYCEALRVEGSDRRLGQTPRPVGSGSGA